MNATSIFSICALAAIPLSSNAAVIYSTTFPEATDTAPAGWVILAGAAGSTSSPGWHIDGGQDYRFNASGNGLSSYQGAVTGGFDSTALTDATVEATFRKGADNSFTGIVGRGSSTDTYYHTRLQGDNFQLFRVNSGTFTTLGTSVTLTGGDIYPGGVAYRIMLDMQGSNITATLFDELNSQIAQIAVNDLSASALTSGYTGLRAQNPNAYESFQLSAVPEPTVPMLGGLAVLLLCGTRRRV